LYDANISNKLIMAEIISYSRISFQTARERDWRKKHGTKDKRRELLSHHSANKK